MWEALRDQLPDGCALFHSVQLIEGDREREADLVVAWPGAGIAVIEVKGGHVTRREAQWFQESEGRRRPIDSPVAQAQDARHLLTRYLTRRHLPSFRAVHLVAFPYTAVARSWDAPECTRQMVIARGDVHDAASIVVHALRSHGGGFTVPDEAAVDDVVRVLAGELTSQASYLAAAAEHDDRVEQMTHDQARVLDMLRYHRRLRVVGGAGTGKTWLALEQARRLAGQGQEVALMCYSRGLARYFERTTATWRQREWPAYVGLFHRLPAEWGAPAKQDDESDSDYYEQTLPCALADLATHRAAADRFDAIVVDEGQDFGELWWPAVIACLRDRVNGALFVFEDEAQRVFPRPGATPIDLPPFVLDENIRNTKNIAQVFGSLAREQLRYRGTDGPPVVFHQCAPEDAVGCADDAVDTLVEEGFESGQIALLTTHYRHPLQRHEVELGGWERYWDAFFAGEDVFYGHVLGFKGLERSAVVLAVNGLRQRDRAKERLYVGLSRARSVLVVCGDLAEIAAVGGEGVRRRLAAARV